MSAESDFNELALSIIETLLSNPVEFGAPVPLERLPTLEEPALPGPASAPRLSDLPEFVLESESGLLLGEPPAASFSLAVPVTEFGRTGSLAWTFGPDLGNAAGAGRTRDFMQIILVQSPEAPSRPLLSAVSSLRSLAGRLPGYMAHSVGDETTARVHRNLLAAGLTMENLAAAHLAQARDRGFSGPVIVVAGIPSARAMELFAPFGDTMRRILADMSTAAAKAADTADADRATGSAAGCDGRACGDCDERDICDKVREILKRYPAPVTKRGLE